MSSISSWESSLRTRSMGHPAASSSSMSSCIWSQVAVIMMSPLDPYRGVWTVAEMRPGRCKAGSTGPHRKIERSVRHVSADEQDGATENVTCAAEVVAAQINVDRAERVYH